MLLAVGIQLVYGLIDRCDVVRGGVFGLAGVFLVVVCRLPSGGLIFEALFSK